MLIQGAKIIVTGLAIIGLIIIGTVYAITGLMNEKVLYLGVGVLSNGVIFMLSSASIILICAYKYTGKIGWVINLVPIPSVPCLTCLERGIEKLVLPGINCPNCFPAYRNLA